MVVISPSDYVEAVAATRAALEYNGPVYLRFGRAPITTFNDNEDYKFIIGKGITLKEGDDLTIVANGICVGAAVEAAERFEKEGIKVRVINIHTIKPLDEELILKAARETKFIITVEEHSVIGGLGSAVCDCVCANIPVPVYKLGMNDVYGESGTASELIAKYGLDAEGIYQFTKKQL